MRGLGTRHNFKAGGVRGSLQVADTDCDCLQECHLCLDAHPLCIQLLRVYGNSQDRRMRAASCDGRDVPQTAESGHTTIGDQPVLHREVPACWWGCCLGNSFGACLVIPPHVCKRICQHCDEPAHDSRVALGESRLHEISCQADGSCREGRR